MLSSRSVLPAACLLVLIWPVAEAQAPTPPTETASSYLRTPAAIAGLSFDFEGKEGWEISEVTFGIRDGRLMLASFRSHPPGGTDDYIDDSGLADFVVADTSQLPVPVRYALGKTEYEITGFTLGSAADGTPFVDWVALVDSSGANQVKTFSAPNQYNEDSGCYISTTTVCAGLFCTSACTQAGSDPCDCSGSGFCFVDYQIFRCRNNGNCLGTCLFVDQDRCGCFLEDGCSFP